MTSNPWAIVPKIANGWALAAFAIAALLVIARLIQRKPLAAYWGIIAGIVAVGLAPMVLSAVVQRTLTVYHVHVVVLDDRGTVIGDAGVTVSSNFIPKKVEGGWELDIPAEQKPRDSLVVRAQRGGDERGVGILPPLGPDFYPTLTIRLARDTDGVVSGMVEDSVTHEAIAGAQVEIVGGLGVDTTKAGGSFYLRTHGAQGETVRVHAQARGYVAGDILAAARKDDPALILLHSVRLGRSR